MMVSEQMPHSKTFNIFSYIVLESEAEEEEEELDSSVDVFTFLSDGSMVRSREWCWWSRSAFGGVFVLLYLRSWWDLRL
jgi:hypothetical protein